MQASRETSATGDPLTRLTKEDGSGDYTWAVGPGAAAAVFPNADAFAMARLEISVPQTDSRTIAFAIQP